MSLIFWQKNKYYLLFLSPSKTGQTLLYARQLENQDTNSRFNKNHICERKISAMESSNQTQLHSSSTSASLEECYSLWQLYYFPCNKPTCNVVPSDTSPSDSAWQAPRLTLPSFSELALHSVCTGLAAAGLSSVPSILDIRITANHNTKTWGF